MFKYFLIILLFLKAGSSFSQKTHHYPLAPKDSTVDVYFDNSIEDPYQWMENPNDPRLKEWLDSQKKIIKKEKNKAKGLLTLRAQIGSLYKDVKKKTTDSYVIKDKNLLSKYDFKYNTKNHYRFPDLQYKLRDKTSYKTLVKNKIFENGRNDNVAIINRYVNEDYDLIAIEMSHNGSDWLEVYFFDLQTGEQLPDVLKNLRKGGYLVWDKQNIYYEAYDEPIKGRKLLDKATDQKLYYHKIGTAQADDLILYENIDPTGTNDFNFYKLDDKLIFNHHILHQNKVVNVLSVSEIEIDNFFMKKFLYYTNSGIRTMKVEELFGNNAIIKTDMNAPNGKVLLADITKLNKPVALIPEYDIVLREVNRLGNDKIACIYRDESHSFVMIYDLNGELLKTIDISEGKKINNLYESDKEASHTDFSISSFYHPELWYQLSLDDLSVKPKTKISVPYDPESLETRYVQYKSKDGTLIPMYITCLKETKLNGNKWVAWLLWYHPMLHGYITIRCSR